MNLLPSHLLPVARRIEALVLDVDGVLTDGSLWYSEDGEQLKRFNVKDGLGLRVLQECGLQVAVITARAGAPLTRRMRDLGVTRVRSGVLEKGAAFESLARELELELEAIAYVGDDVVDLPVLRRVGLSIAVADAHAWVREQVHWVTRAPGGCGAVREVADALLQAREDYPAAYERLLEGSKRP